MQVLLPLTSQATMKKLIQSHPNSRLQLLMKNKLHRKRGHNLDSGDLPRVCWGSGPLIGEKNENPTSKSGNRTPEPTQPLISTSLFSLNKKGKGWWYDFSRCYAFFLRSSTATMAMAMTIMAVAAMMYMPTGSGDSSAVVCGEAAFETMNDMPASLL